MLVAPIRNLRAQGSSRDTGREAESLRIIDALVVRARAEPILFVHHRRLRKCFFTCFSFTIMACT